MACSTNTKGNVNQHVQWPPTLLQTKYVRVVHPNVLVALQLLPATPVLPLPNCRYLLALVLTLVPMDSNTLFLTTYVVTNNAPMLSVINALVLIRMCAPVAVETMVMKCYKAIHVWPPLKPVPANRHLLLNSSTTLSYKLVNNAT